MSYTYHPDNAGKSADELISLAEAELVAMCRRHFDKSIYRVLRTTIPARAEDSDVLLQDTLHRAQDELEALRRENAELVKAVKGVVWYLNNAIVSLPHPAALPPQHQVIADLEALIAKAEGKHE